MAVIARMVCTKNEKTSYGDNRNVQLSAVYSSDPSSPNYSYSQASPSASLTIYISNPDAYEQFEVNKQYDLTFTPVE